jgi:MoaA/NifB/PqqE/SkfB family radical SAM enzyme/predicted SAM-dependent methyltransferase
MSASHGWSFATEERKREIIEAIRTGTATRGPVHAELDLTDRCNVACYFCNQMDVRTKESMPLERILELLEEMAGNGLKSVRLSGGGDPLMYRHFVEVQDALAEHGVVIDNLTTNGALMKPEIAERLVQNQAREVIFSLNAANPKDYQRMMRVAAKVFDQVVENARHLVALKQGAALPNVVVQFLIDPENFRELPAMYRLARELGVDQMVLNAVLEIPNERLDTANLLRPNDFPRVQPYLEEIVSQDAQAGILNLCFPWQEWNDRIARFRTGIEAPARHGFATAPAFEEKNGHCFFGWYTATIRGTGEMYPCCMLMSPDYEPLGNVNKDGGTFADQWHGPTFTRLREEMRDVLLADGRVRQSRLKTLKPQCVEAHRCGLKNMYFRGDQQFYQELGEALEEAREREIRWFGKPRQIARAAEIFGFRVYHGVKVRGEALGRRFKNRFLARIMPELIQRPRLHIGCGNKHLDGWINIDMQPYPEVDVVADVTQGLRFRNAEAVYAEHFIEHLKIDQALQFLEESHRVLGEGGVLRLSTPNLDWVWATHYGLEGEDDLRFNMAVHLNRAFHGWEHQFLWNQPTMEKVLTACGFTDIRWESYGQSERKFLRNLERHETYSDAPGLHHILVVEATRGDAQPEQLAALKAYIHENFLNHMKG